MLNDINGFVLFATDISVIQDSERDKEKLHAVKLIDANTRETGPTVYSAAWMSVPMVFSRLRNSDLVVRKSQFSTAKCQGIIS